MVELEWLNNLPKLEEKKWNYLEEIKVSHRETIMAEVLRYYFDSNEKHGLGDIFIRSLLETPCFKLKEKKVVNAHLYEKIKDDKQILNSFNNVKVRTEVSTSKKTKVKGEKDSSKYIDILIETEKLVICIEFKINHDLNNPLNTYQKFIEEEEAKCFKGSKIKRELIFVVLTPFWKAPISKAQNNENFVQITLAGFIDNVQRLVGDFWSDKKGAHQYYLYQDFINVIENRGRIVSLIKEYSQKGYTPEDIAKIEGLNPEVLEKLGLDKIKTAFEGKTKELIKRGDKGYSLLNATKDRIDSGVFKKDDDVEYKIRLSLAGWFFEKWTDDGKVVKENIGTFFMAIDDVVKKVGDLEANKS